nr:MAG TPA: hypothetical protein [Caudoviricetes sp.]DAZ84054.1 MAG TPA: hypothetical protein [Caudoviricetes sp.]
MSLADKDGCLHTYPSCGVLNYGECYYGGNIL